MSCGDDTSYVAYRKQSSFTVIGCSSLLTENYVLAVALLEAFGFTYLSMKYTVCYPHQQLTLTVLAHVVNFHEIGEKSKQRGLCRKEIHKICRCPGLHGVTVE